MYHLSRAADTMNSLFRRQYCRDTSAIISLLRRLQQHLPEKSSGAVEHYLTMLTMQNGPWAMIPRKNHLLEASREELLRAAREAGEEAEFHRLEDYFFAAVPFPLRAEFYPEDLSDEEYEGMGPEAGEVNSAILRGEDGSPKAVRNEVLFRKVCDEAITHLRRAREYADDPDFVLYLDAKIEELQTGSPESRRIADYHWIRHDHDIDIIISTALEVYLDGWRNVKGSACGIVTRKDSAKDDLLRRLKELVPELEEEAPWRWRREEIDPESLPKIKFVDVYNWTGDYVTMPNSVLAQSLPNDEWVGKNVGTVNMVYSNTGEARHSLTGALWQKEFLPEEVHSRYGELMHDGGELHSVMHEIGHTTGRQDPEHPGRPADYLQSEYSVLEETRAELFGMWSADRVGGRGVVEPEQVTAGHYHMLIVMVSALKFEPEQAHNIARNMIFHRLLNDGAIVETEEQGRTVFDYDFVKLPGSVERMLGEVANLKASGDREGAARLREELCFADPRRQMIEERTGSFPQGVAFRFPRFMLSGGAPTEALEYPEYTEQYKFADT
jgi:hypothetical protein